jgi:transcriptional regulator with XRE-family HTH domain
MKEEIISYLEGPRSFDEGVALYEKFGINRMLKAQFRRMGITSLTAATLMEELRKLAGLTEKEFKNMSRKSHVPAEEKKEIIKKIYADDVLEEIADKFGITVDELVSDDFVEKVTSSGEYADKIDELEEELENVKSLYNNISDTTKKTIRFRESFPFLKEPDCPDILKVLVADMFTAYGKYREAHAQLADMPDDAELQETAKLSEEIVENFLANREIWDELEFYRDNHSLLGKCDKVKELQASEDLKNMSDIDLMTARNNASANLSKAKKRIENTEDTDEDSLVTAKQLLEKWDVAKSQIEAEIDSRKKN